MAELVQAALDDMVAPLRDWLDRGIFTQAEINAIVSRRRESEYALRRRAARKADFLRYIEAEMALESLRELRTKKASRRQRDEVTRETTMTQSGERRQLAPTGKKIGGLPIGDVHIVQLIHLLFTRALRKFRSDVALHLQHAAFAKKSKSFHKLTTIYTEALQVHPRVVGLWIEAASYEFFGHDPQVKGENAHGGGSIQSARILMQRGLRINNKSEDLWIQYFCLELHYLQKLRGRREILQLTNEKEDVDPLYRDAPVAAIVYKNAIKAIPDNVSFRMKFIEQCQLFPQTDTLEGIIAESIAKDFAEKPDAWIARASYIAGKQHKAKELSVGFVLEVPQELVHDAQDYEPANKKIRTESRPDPVLQILEQALDAIPTAEMCIRVITFCQAYSNQSNADSTKDFIDTVFKRANTDEQIEVTVELILQHASFLRTQGNIEGAINCLRGSSFSPGNVEVAIQLATLLRINKQTETAMSELTKCLKLTPLHDPQHMTVLLELFGAMMDNEASFSDLKSIFNQILLLSPSNNPTFDAGFGVGSVAHACLLLLRRCKGQHSETKAVIDAVLESSTYCDSHDGKTETEINCLVSFFDEAIQGLQPTGKKINRENNHLLRRLFAKGIHFFQDCAPDMADTFRSRKHDFEYSR